MSEERSSYRQIMKATSLFGGVQIFNIIIGIVRSKFLAVLLGPAGMGIAGLLNSTTGLIASITNFGLGTSAVKNVAEAYASKNNDRMSTVVAVFKRLVWITGLLGTFITFLLAPLLSRFTFNNTDYTIAFRVVSIILLLGQLSTGQLVVLQGMRKLQLLAKANMAGSVVGLLLSIPIYYWLGQKGIVPAIIITSVFGLMITIFFSSKIKVEGKKINFLVLKSEGLNMLKMGFILSLTNLIGLGISYILGIYISRMGGVEQVGLYNAGFAIINGYVGMIFTAMITDYFPKLSEVSSDNKKAASVINQQAEMGILIIAPILSFFIVFISFIVSILYSSRFFAINEMMQYVALGIFLKMITWAMSLMIIAKGDTKLFFISELAANIYTLLLNMLFYRFFGLNGIGIAFIVAYILGVFQTFIILKWKYNFLFESGFLKIFMIHFSLAVLCFLLVRNFNGIKGYLYTIPIIITSLAFSFVELNNRLDVLSFFRNIISKKK